jgi:hypothetical protein
MEGEELVLGSLDIKGKEGADTKKVCNDFNTNR